MPLNCVLYNGQNGGNCIDLHTIRKLETKCSFDFSHYFPKRKLNHQDELQID